MPDSKADRLKAAIDAERAAAEAHQALVDAERAFSTRQDAYISAAQHAEQSRLDAEAEERIAALQVAEANEKKHREACTKQCHGIHQRKRAREARGEACDPTKIKVVEIDDAVHEIVGAHELMLGAKGFGVTPDATPGSRYKTACGYSIDAPHDELDHARFDQTRKPNCPKCSTAIAEMDAGTRPDTRGEYLSSKEQLAHAKAECARQAKASTPA